MTDPVVPADPNAESAASEQHADQRQQVQVRFGSVATAYVSSTTHAHGGDLRRLLELGQPAPTDLLLDVATGGGHTALAFAPLVERVVASDMTLAMLEAAREHISAQGSHNVDYCRAIAEALPFASGSFDMVTCRVAAHHFAHIQAFVREAARVLRPGGRLLISDHVGLDDPDLDAFMDRFERWRDPGHVRSYSYAEWHTFCDTAGLTVEHSEDYAWEPYQFADWTARIGMPEDEKAALEHWLLVAEDRFRDFFEIVVQDGRVLSLRSTFGILLARKLNRR